MPFIPNTDNDRKLMFERIGVKNFSELISNIPDELKFKGDLDLPPSVSELEISKIIQQKAGCNTQTCDTISFLGGGAYDHFIPAAVNFLLSRSEFYTAYTPYQAEVSQGTLQVIYEYQSMIAELMGMEVANASMYDGGSALAEAALMAVSETRKKKILISKSVHPYYRQVVKTYCHGQGIEIELIELDQGITSLASLKSSIDNNVAAVIIEHPNFLGYLEEVFEISSLVHENKALLITSNDPISLGAIEPPGEYDIDIATGEGQCLGNPLNYGGPYLGIFAAKQKYVRKMPGRIAGATTDSQGRRGFVLTFQAREQHIRRAKATSNICTNQALNALAATIYMALMGEKGIQEVASLCLQNSHYLADNIGLLDGYELRFTSPFFKEFVVTTPLPAKQIIDALSEKNIFAGIDLSSFDYGFKNEMLVAVTEKRTKDEMDRFVELLANINLAE
ncbi:aminomethyl-transferring glycine dehydrogenase subunit GcvPA [candidate division KSB1 bacterium]|nr:aminomethyl-transferring glycine dehydrogenase subunit GcvPA [candidate division KSB1 bacterium]MBL7094050.1 aminomethyl-transferring glycine dehydrogenase subunit GcvPA [candidate division KSB1 bacterium]